MQIWVNLSKKLFDLKSSIVYNHTMKNLDEYNKLPITGDATPPEPRKDIPIEHQIDNLKEMISIIGKIKARHEKVKPKNG